MVAIALIRHGESNATVNRTIGGYRTCSGLSELGRRQAERLRNRLAETGELRPARLIASNFARAIETAEIISPAVGAEVVIDPGFGEHDPGPELDGVTFAAYVDRFGTPNWSGDPHRDFFPGGETTAQFHVRVGAALSALLRTLDNGERVVISCHGGVVDAAFRQLLRTAPTGAFELQTLNTSITEFGGEPDRDRDNGLGGTWRLLRYNDAAHLAGLPIATPATDGATA